MSDNGDNMPDVVTNLPQRLGQLMQKLKFLKQGGPRKKDGLFWLRLKRGELDGYIQALDYLFSEALKPEEEETSPLWRPGDPI